MLTKDASRSLRALVAAGLVLVQAVLPCVVWAQAAAPSAGAAPAAATASGFLSSVTGVVFIRKANGEQVAAKPGDVFEPGSTIVAGANGQVGLLFADGQIIGLSANSTLRVDAYRFDASDIKASRAAIVLVSGAMTVVTGVIGNENPQGLSIAAGNMTLSVAGKDATAFGIEVNAATQAGSVAVTVGALLIRTPAGPAITVGAEQFVRLQAGVATAPPQPLSAAPAALQALAGLARSFAQAETAPVDVQAAAIKLALANLPPAAAGPAGTTPVFLPPVTPGAAGGCVGSPC
ncbi:MAG: hypothetical protein A3H35_14110 [Betaproteobacteria bacterium RIFCSPLOWO2_02_FULL_62_17]|nr:MAG: hypothetical protein A3H35_14110 [Betaproteobacteria bacterium RIFCSPLOWO2_02_FULL_62_17]